jgi:hypothetical protein
MEAAGHAGDGGHILDPFVRRSAVVVAVLAGLLAIATLLSNEAIKTAIVSQDEASSNHALYEANEIKRFVNGDDAKVLRLLAADADRRRAADAERHAATLDQTAIETLTPRDRRLAAQARTEEANHDRADEQHLRFELAMVALEIGIVLASVSIITRVDWLVPAGATLGAVGAVLVVAGLLA